MPNAVDDENTQLPPIYRVWLGRTRVKKEVGHLCQTTMILIKTERVKQQQ